VPVAEETARDVAAVTDLYSALKTRVPTLPLAPCTQIESESTLVNEYGGVPAEDHPTKL
jgi:hypothetical protein